MKNDDHGPLRRSPQGRTFRFTRAFSAVERLEPRCVLSGSSLSHPISFAPPVISFKTEAGSSAYISGPRLDTAKQGLASFDAEQSGPADMGPLHDREVSDISGELNPFASNSIRSAGVFPAMQSASVAGTDVVVMTFPMSGPTFSGYRFAAIEILIIPESGPAMGRAFDISTPEYPGLNLHIEDRMYGAAYANDPPPSGSQAHLPPPRENDLSGYALVPHFVIPEAMSSTTPAFINQPVVTVTHVGTFTAQPTSGAVLQTVSGVMRGVPLVSSRITEHAIQSGISVPSLTTIVDSQSLANVLSLQNATTTNRGGLSCKAAEAMDNSDPAHESSGLIDANASLVGIPLNMRGVEKALQEVLSEIESLESQVTGWLNHVRLAPLTIVVTAGAMGGATAYYLRRRGDRQADRREDEASSSWLFLRMQPCPSE